MLMMASINFNQESKFVMVWKLSCKKMELVYKIMNYYFIEPEFFQYEDVIIYHQFSLGYFIVLYIIDFN